MARKYLNNYTTLLSAAITDTDTTMTVGTAPAALAGGDYYRLQLSLRNAQGVLTKQEFVDVTAISGNDLTITRAAEGSTALSWDVGARVELVETADSWDGLATDAEVAQSIADHVAETDPHPQYTTEAEAAAAAPVQSVDGKTGAVDLSGDYDPTGSAAAAQAYAIQRANHTGTQPLSTISDAGTAAAADVQTSPTDNTAGRILTTGASPMILSVDPLRKAVESESGGRQTIIYTAKGQPSWMYVLPKFNMEDIPGWTAGAGTHPAFIANGVEQSEIMVGVYQAAEIDGEAVSQPGLYPRVGINYDQARALCQANGTGHDLMGIWDWAAIALWCMANGFQPRGNTNYGRHHDNKWETGIAPDGATLGSDATGVANTKTGSGPNSWNHDNSPGGIADLVGNVWEWLYGMKILDGVVQLAPDNGEYLESEYTNTAFTLPSSRTWSTIDPTGAPDSLKQALIVPNGVADPLGYHSINLTGERLPSRGGSRGTAGDAGLAAVLLGNGRTSALSSLAFRPRYRPQ